MLGTLSAEIFDPAGNAGAGAFIATANMSTIRLYHSAVLLANGSVLVAGGNYGSAALSSAEIFE